MTDKPHNLQAINMTETGKQGGGLDPSRMLDIMADLECALVMTREHDPTETVGGFVDCSIQFKRLADFLHSVQHLQAINVVPADDDLVELQPCPFCGAGAVADETSVGAFVYCPNEECFIQPETGAFQNVADAVAKWNTRASLSSELARCRNALDDLQQAEFEYRLMHDRHGDGATATGRAWDLLRRAGDNARAALNPIGERE